jgi:phosphate transport system protein
VIFVAILGSSIQPIDLRHWYPISHRNATRAAASMPTKEHLITRIAKAQLLQFGNSPAIAFSSDTVILSTDLMALGGKHSIPGFDQSLEDLRADILMMATLVRRNLSNAKTGFVQRDEDCCSGVIADDEEVDLLVKQVDRAGTNILICFQPLASDFRTVLATIKLASHLENISDQTVSIARRVRALIQENALEEEQELSFIFGLVDASLAEALEAFSAVDDARAEKLRRQMEPLAQSARDLLENFSDAVGKNPERSGFYVNVIMMTRSLEQIIYLIESITEDITYVAEAKDIRHATNRLALEKDQ